MTLCMIVLVSMGAAGICVGNAYRKREQLIAGLIRELCRLQEQVRMGKTLKEALQAGNLPIFSGIADDIDECGVQAAWRRLSEKRSNDDLLSFMELPERQIMERFWEEAGMLDFSRQMARFDEACKSLQSLHGDALEESRRRSRLYGSLGTLLGLAAVVLLW